MVMMMLFVLIQQQQMCVCVRVRVRENAHKNMCIFIVFLACHGIDLRYCACTVNCAQQRLNVSKVYRESIGQ